LKELRLAPLTKTYKWR